jgi:two-component system, OmpR family, response regulator
MQVLIIDDNIEVTDMLSFYLQESGYECKVVNDGKHGIEAIRSEDFDLALLDLAMPEFSGMDIIKSLKTDNLLEKKKVVVLTASTLSEDETDRLLRDGIRAVLKKPISIDELTTTIEQLGQ